jgi:hypothetical protein
VKNIKRLPYPENVLGCILQLDGFRGLNLTDGSAVALWKDQSPAGNNAVQATPSLQPIFKLAGLNGFPAVQFDGVNDFLSADGVGVALSGNSVPFTVVVAARIITVTNGGYLWSLGNSGNATPLAGLRMNSAPSNPARFSRVNDAGVATSSDFDMLGSQTSIARVWRCNYTGGQVLSGGAPGENGGDNGVSIGQCTLNEFTIGALRRTGVGQWSNIMVAGMSVFKRSLSDIELYSVARYYSRMYNISLLP